MPHLRLRRGDDGAALLRRMVVRVNGETVARLRRNTEETVTVGAGRCLVSCHMDWQSSETLALELAGSDSVTVEVGIGWRALGTLWSTEPGALDIRLVGGRHE